MTTTTNTTSIIQIREIAHSEDNPMSRTAEVLLDSIRGFRSACKSVVNSAEEVQRAAATICDQVQRGVNFTNFVGGHARHLNESVVRRNEEAAKIVELSYCLKIEVDWSEINI